MVVSSKVLLFIILLLGFLVRLYRFDAPLADWHSWRQVDTSSVSRTFVSEGINFLYPKYHDLSNVPSGIYHNPQGYRFVEFPIYNALSAGGFLIFGNFTIEEWGRLITIFSSLIAALFLYLILKKHSSIQVALLGTFFYTLLPFNIFWGRTVLPDQTAIMAVLGGIYFFDSYIDLNKKNSKKLLLFFLTVIFLASALLIKPFVIFFFLPLIYLIFKKWGKESLSRIDLWTIAAFTILPFVLWRVWMLQFPAGIPQAAWLFNGSDIRFKGAFFHWIFAERIGELILGSWGVAILVIGIITKKKDYFYLTFLLSSLIYLFTVATGNVTHDYYQILIMPTIAIFLALGSHFLINPPAQFISKKASRFILLVCAILSVAFSWYQVRDYYNIQNPVILTAGEAVDRLTPADAKIIALYEGDTTLLYHTKRKGWASFSKSIEGLIRDGATHLLIINPEERDLELAQRYKLLERTSNYLIFEL